MSKQRVAKITISIGHDLLQFADRLAREGSTSRSGVIAELLEKEEQARIQALMEEGYLEIAEENRRLAEEAFPLAAEVLKRDTRWNEPADS